MGRTRQLVADAALAVTLAVLTWGTIELDRGCECPRPWWALSLHAVVFGTAWILGDSVRVHRAYTG